MKLALGAALLCASCAAAGAEAKLLTTETLTVAEAACLAAHAGDSDPPSECGIEPARAAAATVVVQAVPGCTYVQTDAGAAASHD